MAIDTGGVFTVGASGVGGTDTLGGPEALVVPPPPDPEPVPGSGTPLVPTIPKVPEEWKFLDQYTPPKIDYTFVVGVGSPQYVLSRALDVSIELNLKEQCAASFSLNALDPLAKQVVELQSDLWIFRNNEKLFRGRIGPSQDNYGADGGVCRFTAVDYRGLLTSRRFIYDDDLYFWYDTDVAVIIKDLIDQVQARTGGSYGLTFNTGFPTVGVVRTEVELSPGQSVGEAINNLQESKVRGFDWEVDPDLKVNVWAKRGTNPAAKRLEYQVSVPNFTREFQTDDFANVVRASGGDMPDPVVLAASTLNTDPRGRWEKEVSWPDVETQQIMEDRVEYLLEQVNTVPESYNITLRKGAWKGKGDLFLGDGVKLVINYGRLGVSKDVRVHGITLRPDGDGGEDVQVSVQ